MLDDVSPAEACARLQAALSGRALPATQENFAKALAERLDNGVRLVLLGPKGVGKSWLCDAILQGAHRAVPEGISRHFYMGGTAAQTLPLDIPMQSLPLEYCPLGHVQILDLDYPDAVQADDVTSKALEFADIVLWCSQEFDAAEAAQWATASDELKDRSFLVLTKADILAREGRLNDRIQALQEIAAEEFYGLLPTTSAQLLHLTAQGRAVPEGPFAASGLKALVEVIQGIVASGQRADLDNALLLLERHGLTAQAGPVSPSPQAAAAVAPEKVVLNAATETIMARAYDLAELGFDQTDGDMSDVLALCGTISEELVEEVEKQSDDHPNLKPWYHAFQDASDKIMLMGLENDARSAADAVTILLQLRRDLQSLQVS